MGGLALTVRTQSIARARRIVALALLVGVAGAGFAAPPAGGEPEAEGWRAAVGARIEVGWAADREAYREILASPRPQDRRGGVTLPALAEAEAAGVDTVPLLYQLLLIGPADERSGEWIAALGRRLRAIAAAEPERVDLGLLAAWTLADGVFPAVRVEVAWSLAVASGARHRTLDHSPDRTEGDLDRLRASLAAEARRVAPSREVAMALLEGLVAVARVAGPARGKTVRDLERLAPALGLSAERTVHAVGEIGGVEAERAVLAYLYSTPAETEKGWALSVLPRIDSDRALASAFDHTSETGTTGYLREAAIEALGRFAFRAATADRLEAIARQDSRPWAERRRALEAFREMMRRRLPEGPREHTLDERLRRLEQEVSAAGSRRAVRRR